MTTLLHSPPIVFLFVLLVILCLSKLVSKLSFKPANKPADGQTKPYACGENISTHMIQPDYKLFFPFAFFFTILHVVALMIALIPVGTFGTFVMSFIYILGAMIGLLILYRR